MVVDEPKPAKDVTVKSPELYVVLASSLQPGLPLPSVFQTLFATAPGADT